MNNTIGNIQLPSYVVPMSAGGGYTIIENFKTIADKFIQNINILKITSATGTLPISGNFDDVIISLSGAPTQNFTYETTSPYTSGYWQQSTPLFGDMAYDRNTSDIYQFSGVNWEAVEQPGDIKISAYGTAPNGWLYCDGSTLAVSAYQNLFNKIGYAYGGAGSNFNIPDLQARVGINRTVGVMTIDQVGRTLTTRSLGQIGGEEVHLLDTTEIPSHNHTYTKIDGNGPGNPNTGGFDSDTATNTGNTGGNLVHNNMSPFTVISYFIRY
jgi:microcystin-dependent protein